MGNLFNPSPPPPPVAPMPAMPTLSPPAPMPVPSAKDQQQTAEVQIAQADAPFTTRANTIIGNSDLLG